MTKPNIKEYISLRLEELESKRVAGAEEVLRYLTSVMRGEEKDQFGLDPSIQDRNSAAKLLGMRYGLFVEKKEVTGKMEPITIVNDIPRKPDGG